MIDISFLYDEIFRRKSYRTFEEKPIDKSIEKKILEFISTQSNSDAKIELVCKNSDHIFKGIIGNYGKIKNSEGYLAISGKNIIKAGYLGELTLLYALSLGLDSCWISGMFNQKEVCKDGIDVKNLLAVIALGYRDDMRNSDKLLKFAARSYKRKDLSQLIEEPDFENVDSIVLKGIEAAKVAPSAANRQPWRFKIKDDKIIIKGNTNTNRVLLDIGICLAHIDITYEKYNIKDKFEIYENEIIYYIKNKGGNNNDI